VSTSRPLLGHRNRSVFVAIFISVFGVRLRHARLTGR
jgi:hypothetical protein